MLFLYVLVSQRGVPLPSGPVIMAAGALGAAGRIGVGTSVAIVVLASLCADSVWYLLGRTRGSRVVRILCRISLEPEACVRKAENAVGRCGARFLLIAKFFPGLGLMAAPVAGQAKVGYLHFVAFDSAGALIWALTYVSLGLFLGEWIERNAFLFQVASRFAAAAVLVAVIAVVAVRLIRRRRFRRLLATARITPGAPHDIVAPVSTRREDG
jgi:membrane protein DedA with SNARE-associated domain